MRQATAHHHDSGIGMVFLCMMTFVKDKNFNHIQLEKAMSQTIQKYLGCHHQHLLKVQ